MLSISGIGGHNQREQSGDRPTEGVRREVPEQPREVSQEPGGPVLQQTLHPGTHEGVHGEERGQGLGGRGGTRGRHEDPRIGERGTLHDDRGEEAEWDESGLAAKGYSQ